ncbi:MAG: gamma-glutamyl-gamma-aminobutyrate hydrolase family protein [Roseburia sp.]|nr:gamma-glutamyl-gamma-aminobutyrate hydrolase family protein [Roseburia sp.]
MKIAIFGRTKDTPNYRRYVKELPAEALVTLDLGALSSCDAMILPGGGDITPAFFGQYNNGSRNIDTELDILQLKALDYALQLSLPILGICKGMQLINVAFGGTILQNLPTAEIHEYRDGDQYHNTRVLEDSLLYKLTGPSAVVNSAHHQGIGRVGNGLTPVQWCDRDYCIEAIAHKRLPIFGVQWHPERLNPAQSPISGSALLRLFLLPFI